MQILENIEKVLLTEIAGDSGKKSINPDEDLLEQRFVDSLGLMKLILHIENTFGIKVEDEDIIPENFQSLNSMATFVSKKIQNK